MFKAGDSLGETEKEISIFQRKRITWKLGEGQCGIVINANKNCILIKRKI